MVFSSAAFLFFFFPFTLAVYFKLPKRHRNLFLLIASLFFYGYGEPFMISIMLLTIVIDYLAALGISGTLGGGWRQPVPLLERAGPRTRSQKAYLTASIVSNLGMLALFKYFNFGVENYNEIVASLGLQGWVWHRAPSVLLPVGISFYTFQSMSYTIDVYRGEVKANRSLIDFACFVTLFPQLIAGPIVRYEQIAAELDQRTENIDEFGLGIQRFILGLAKKTLIADMIALTCDQLYAIPLEHMTPGLAWLATLTFSVQVYFDFSGYSDMAIGMGLMLGFHFRENFNYPYVAHSVTELWRRWHISLATWFRDYFFIPMGGSRRSPARVYFNLLCTFFLVGLWHGANWTYVCFGLMHGIFLLIERYFRNVRYSRLLYFPGIVYTHLVWLVAAVLFRSTDIHQAWVMIKAMFGVYAGDGAIYNARNFLSPDVIVLLVIGYIASTPILPAIARFRDSLTARLAPIAARSVQFAAWSLSTAYLLAIFADSISVILFRNTSPFIYYRF